VVGGISYYGNCVGIPDVGGHVSFESCYLENPLVNAMCVGLVRRDRSRARIRRDPEVRSTSSARTPVATGSQVPRCSRLSSWEPRTIQSGRPCRSGIHSLRSC
jgi:hypothetical protein